MIKLAILFGGLSSEHEVSRVSASSILRNADKTKYEIYPVGITKQGQWRLYEGDSPEEMAAGEWEGKTVPALLSPDRETHGLLVFRAGKTETVSLDCVFPVLHGFGGEDGTVQGLCTLAGIPCVGPGVAASANAMDKSLTKIVADAAGIRQAKYYLALAADYRKDAATLARAAEQAVGAYPMFVKPCSSGSSVGVTRANDFAGLAEGLAEAFRWDSKVLVEEFIDGQEIEVAVLGNHEPIASVAGEIAPAQSFYTYDAKYNDDSSKLYIPAHISERAMQAVREAALRVYAAMGCRGLSRVDFFCTRHGEEIIFNEINTIPGFTSISMYPKLFAYGGIAYSELIDRLIALAMEDDMHG